MNTRVCVPGAHICVCVHVYANVCSTCTHMRVHVYTHVYPIGHVFAFRENTCLLSDEHSCVCVCVFRARINVCVAFTCAAHMCVFHVCRCACVCAFTCAHLCLPPVHICVFTCTHVFQLDTCLCSR